MNIYHETLPVFDGCFGTISTRPNMVSSSEFSDLLGLVTPRSDLLLPPIDIVVPSTNYNLTSGTIPTSNEFSALLNLVIPNNDELLTPVALAPIGCPPHGLMPQLSTLPYQNELEFCSAESQTVKIEIVKAEPFSMNVSTISLTKKHSTMPSFLAIDAPPIAPYDDGVSTDTDIFLTDTDSFSTDTDSGIFVIEDKRSYNPPHSPLSTHVRTSVKRAIITENDLNTTSPRTKKLRGKCKVEGCNTNKQSTGRCIRHGGGRRCEVEGCTRGAQTKHRCKRHGGGARCKVEGCNTSSQGGGLCRAHGGGKLCSVPGCRKGIQLRGKCATHASRKCSADDCENTARCGGVCSRHKKQKCDKFSALYQRCE